MNICNISWPGGTKPWPDAVMIFCQSLQTWFPRNCIQQSDYFHSRKRIWKRRLQNFVPRLRSTAVRFQKNPKITLKLLGNFFVMKIYNVIPYFCMEALQYNEYLISIVDADGLMLQHQSISSYRTEYAPLCFQWSLLLTWINFNPRMDT